MKRKGLIVVVSGFSGTGKGTLMKALTARYDCYALSVSATTRDPRPGEKEGSEYFFISDSEFEKMIEALEKKKEFKIPSSQVDSDIDKQYQQLKKVLECILCH